MNNMKRKVMSGKKFLSFILDSETYCLEIIRVKELLGLTSITAIPQTPDFIKGVINLRGQIIPIIDLRLKFGLPFLKYDKRTSVIVIELDFDGELILMGIVVDSITEVIGVEDENIKKIPYINAKIKSDFIKGVANTEDGIIILLDISKVLSEDEFVIIKNAENIEK